MELTIDTRIRPGSARAPDTAEQRYEHARSVLAQAALPLAGSNTTIGHLQHFIAAALAVCDVCVRDCLPDRPLDVLFWLRRRLNKEANKPGRNELYRALCRREVDHVERRIGSACAGLSGGALVPLEPQGAAGAAGARTAPRERVSVAFGGSLGTSPQRLVQGSLPIDRPERFVERAKAASGHRFQLVARRIARDDEAG